MLPEVNTKGMSLMPRPLSNIERDETVDLVATVWKKKKKNVVVFVDIMSMWYFLRIQI